MVAASVIRTTLIVVPGGGCSAIVVLGLLPHFSCMLSIKQTSLSAIDMQLNA